LLPDSVPARTKSALHQTKATSSPHEADDDPGVCERWRLAALLLFGPCGIIEECSDEVERDELGL
jgi:hypothetical protein